MDVNGVLPIVICIDVEPDETVPDDVVRDRWPGYEECHALFSELRPWAETMTGAPAHFGWFLRMDPSVGDCYGAPGWVTEEYPALIDAARCGGDDVGLHVHASRRDPVSRAWYLELDDQDWIEHCVRTAFDSFERALGTGCRSFRFGNHWMNQETWALLDRLGRSIDLTIEPGAAPRDWVWSGETVRGCLPDYFGVPRTPFRPSAADFRRPDPQRSTGAWVLPVSTAPDRAEVADPDGPMPIAQRVAATYAPLFLAAPNAAFLYLVRRCLGLGDHPVLVCPMRSETMHGELGRNVRANLRSLAELAGERLVRFVTPAEALELRARSLALC
jgi:hypothetical protein